MLHLFKKTYIQISDLLDTTEKRIVISENVGEPDDVVPTIGELVHYAKSTEELIGEEKPYKSICELLLSLAEQDDRVVIFLDKKPFLEFVCTWFKVIFPNGDKDTTWKLIKSHFIREKLVGGTNIKDFNSYTDFEPTYEEYAQSYDACHMMEHSDRISNNIIDSAFGRLSLEYLISSYIGSHKQKCKQTLKTTLQILIERAITQTIIESKYTTFRKALRKPFVEKMGLREYKFDNVDQIVNDGAVQIVVNSHFCSSKGTTEFGSRSEINLKNITDEEIEELDIFLNKVYPDLEYKSYLKDYIKFVRSDNPTDAQLDNILTNETSADEQLFSTIDLENINIYFMDFALQNINNPDILKPYVIRKG